MLRLAKAAFAILPRLRKPEDSRALIARLKQSQP